MAEERITNYLTGGQKGKKLERWDLLPWPELQEVARLYGRGALKYADRNWEKGYNVSLSFAALQRHLIDGFWAGEDTDPETQCHHLASVVFHALAMMRFTNGSLPATLDDRPSRKDPHGPQTCAPPSEVYRSPDTRLSNGVLLCRQAPTSNPAGQAP